MIITSKYYTLCALIYIIAGVHAHLHSHAHAHTHRPAPDNDFASKVGKENESSMYEDDR